MHFQGLLQGLNARVHYTSRTMEGCPIHFGEIWPGHISPKCIGQTAWRNHSCLQRNICRQRRMLATSHPWTRLSAWTSQSWAAWGAGWCRSHWSVRSLKNFKLLSTLVGDWWWATLALCLAWLSWSVEHFPRSEFYGAEAANIRTIPENLDDSFYPFVITTLVSRN